VCGLGAPNLARVNLARAFGDEPRRAARAVTGGSRRGRRHRAAAAALAQVRRARASLAGDPKYINAW